MAHDDPPCSHRCGTYVGRVSWPPDLDKADGPSASAYVCASTEHQEQTVAWVESATGRRGVFRPFTIEARRSRR